MTTPTCATCQLWVGTETRESSYLGDCQLDAEQQHRTQFDDLCPHWRRAFVDEPTTTRVADVIHAGDEIATRTKQDTHRFISFHSTASGEVNAFEFEMQAARAIGAELNPYTVTLGALWVPFFGSCVMCQMQTLGMMQENALIMPTCSACNGDLNLFIDHDYAHPFRRWRTT